MNTATEVLEAASRLSICDRAAVARQLLLSLEELPFDEDCEAAWRDEIDRRLDRLEKGEAKLLDWNEAYAKLQASLRGRTLE